MLRGYSDTRREGGDAFSYNSSTPSGLSFNHGRSFSTYLSLSFIHPRRTDAHIGMVNGPLPKPEIWLTIKIDVRIELNHQLNH